MSRTLTIVIIFINLAGLLLVQLMESLRPGIISAIVPIGLIWLVGVGLSIVAGLIAPSQQN